LETRTIGAAKRTIPLRRDTSQENTKSKSKKEKQNMTTIDTKMDMVALGTEVLATQPTTIQANLSTMSMAETATTGETISLDPAVAADQMVRAKRKKRRIKKLKPKKLRKRRLRLQN